MKRLREMNNMPNQGTRKKVSPVKDQPLLGKEFNEKQNSVPTCLTQIPMGTKDAVHKDALLFIPHQHSHAKNLLSVFVCSGMGLFLSGCTGTTYSSHFDCPMGEGAKCASLSQINRMIDRHEIDLREGDGRLEKPVPRNQVYIYYGPDQLGHLITIDETPNTL